MSFATKILLFCVSVVLLLEAVHSDKNQNTDLKLDSCKDKSIELTVPSTGTYYLIGQTNKELPRKPNGQLTITVTNSMKGPIKILKVTQKNILQKDSVYYDVDCSSGTIKHVNGSLTVKKPKKTPVNLGIDQPIKMTFKDEKKQDTNVAVVGDKLTMQIESTKTLTNYISIKECTAKAEKGKSSFDLLKDGDKVKSKQIDGGPANITFEAFQFVESASLIEFECTVLVCPTTKQCKAPSNSTHTLFDSEISTMANIEAALAVSLPQYNAAGKASSHEKTVLLALVAVLLQRQFS